MRQELVFQEGGLLIDGEMQVRPSSANQLSFTTSGGDARHLYILLKSYFDWYNVSDAGATIVFEGPEGIKTVAITNDPNDELVANNTVSVLAASEILATEAVFVSAWPYITGSATEDLFEEFPPDQTAIVIDTNRKPIISSLLGDNDDDYETISFIIIGATALAVVDQLMIVPEYIADDPEYISYDIASIDHSIVAVGFNTDRGPVVELRVPIQQKQVSKLQALIGKRNTETLAAELYFVTDINETEDEFTIQPVSSDGFLGAPEKLHLSFD